MEIAEHGVGFPPADQADSVSVDSAAEKGHGATGSKTAGVDVGELKV